MPFMNKFLKLLPLFAIIVSDRCCAQQGEAQPSYFTLINTVPKSTGLKCYIKNSKETNVLTPVEQVADDAAGNGFSTGLVPWLPADGDLTVEAPGRGIVSMKPFIEAGQTPLVVIKPKGLSSIDLSLLPEPVSREGGFYDAINLTEKPELEVTVDGKLRRLPRAQRVRLSTNKTIEYKIPGGSGDALESMDSPSHVLVFFGGDDQQVRCLVVADFAL